MVRPGLQCHVHRTDQPAAHVFHLFHASCPAESPTLMQCVSSLSRVTPSLIRRLTSITCCAAGFGWHVVFFLVPCSSVASLRPVLKILSSSQPNLHINASLADGQSCMTAHQLPTLLLLGTSFMYAFCNHQIFPIPALHACTHVMPHGAQPCTALASPCTASAWLPPLLPLHPVAWFPGHNQR